MLKFLPGSKVIVPSGNGRRLRDAMPPAEGGQNLVREFRTRSSKFFMDSHQVALAAGEQL